MEQSKFDQLLEIVETLKVEYQKFSSGNKSAGTRARKALQEIKGLSQDLRKEIQDSKNTEK